MTLAGKSTGNRFQEAIFAEARSQDIPEEADAYGWLIGSWELDVYDHRAGDMPKRAHGEAHFSWILEGTAVQDTWIAHRVTDETGRSVWDVPLRGTTIRVWNPKIQAWNVTWINPATGAHDELVGKRVGQEIIQEGKHSDGTPIRWTFREIAPDSFHWLGEVLAADHTWKKEGEFQAKRMSR